MLTESKFTNFNLMLNKYYLQYYSIFTNKKKARKIKKHSLHEKFKLLSFFFCNEHVEFIRQFIQ